VPTRDCADLLERCVASLLLNTDYPTLEVLVIDNDSQDPVATALLRRLSLHPLVRILLYPGKFNYAAMNNIAAREALGEVVVLLNNDTESTQPSWLRAMVAHAIRPDVGAVGARLLYPDGRVQHAGIVNQPNIGPTHQFRFSARHDAGPGGALCLARSVTMVTGACLALRRALYLEVDGMDENLRVAFNDVDLCMRLSDHGYRIVWTPAAELFHFEGASRGKDDTLEKQALASSEFERFRRRWGSLLDVDPFCNPNLHYGWDKVVLATPPQRLHPWLVDAVPAG
jgi:GT2 family glycosyltransferase